MIDWPLNRGFDRFFGTIHGAGSFYDPNSLTSGDQFIIPAKNFYYTDAISDTTVKYIDEHNTDKPFFIYVAYTAAHWPKGIQTKGEFREQASQIIDIMATCVDLANAQYPKEANGEKFYPMQGKSLVPSFTNQAIERDALYWEHEGNRAIRMGDWKLVSVANKHHSFWDPFNELPIAYWELYNLADDRTETNNLAAQHPEKVKKMAQKWQV